MNIFFSNFVLVIIFLLSFTSINFGQDRGTYRIPVPKLYSRGGDVGARTAAPVLQLHSTTPPSNGINVQKITSDQIKPQPNTMLKSDIIKTLNIKDMTLLEFARLLSQGAGWKIVVSKQAAATSVNAYFEDIDGENAIRAICQANNLWYRKDGNGIISIMTIDEYRKGLMANSQDTVKVVTLLYPDARAVGDSIQRLFKNRVVWNPPNEYYNDPIDDIERAFDRMESMSDRVNNMQYGQSGGRSSSSSRSSRSGGGRSSSSRNTQQRNTDSLSPNRVVEDIAQNTDDEKLIAQLASGDDEIKVGEPGIIYLSAFRSTNDLMIRSSDPEAVEEIVKVIEQLDKPKPQVLLEVKILDLRLTDDESLGLDWLFKAGKVSGGRSTGVLPDGYGSAASAIVAPAENLLPAGGGIDPKAMVLQVVSNDVLARIQAMQDSGRIISLATPNLCVADGEASRIFIGKETTILTDVTVNTTTTQGYSTPYVNSAVDPVTERMNIGTTLLITPRIHADRTITLRLVQEDSQVGDTQEIIFGSSGNSALSSSNMSFFSKDIETRTVTTTVVASDAQVSAIGGLIRESVNQREVGLPGLMKTPYIGNLFKTSFKTRERHELLVLVRPFVLLAPGEGGMKTEKLLKRLSEHPSAHGKIPPLRIGEGSFTTINERIYDLPKDAFNSIKIRATPWATDEK
jgi:general secretion pathway protein D